MTCLGEASEEFCEAADEAEARISSLRPSALGFHGSAVRISSCTMPARQPAGLSCSLQPVCTPQGSGGWGGVCLILVSLLTPAPVPNVSPLPRGNLERRVLQEEARHMCQAAFPHTWESGQLRCQASPKCHWTLYFFKVPCDNTHPPGVGWGSNCTFSSDI